MKQLGILGMGAMGSSILEALLDTKILNSTDIIIYDHNPFKMERFLSVSHATSIKDLYQNANTLLLAIKPQSINSLRPLASFSHKPLILSVIAATSLQSLSSLLDNPAIIRLMPSLTAQVHQSFTPLAKTPFVTKEQFDFSLALFSSIGQVYPTTEKVLDEMIAITGSFPAYLAYFLVAFQDVATEYSIPRDVAISALRLTTKATIDLLEKSDLSFEELIQNVSSPGGITQEGIKAFKDEQLIEVVRQVVASTISKSKFLTDQNNKKSDS